MMLHALYMYVSLAVYEHNSYVLYIFNRCNICHLEIKNECWYDIYERFLM